MDEEIALALGYFAEGGRTMDFSIRYIHINYFIKIYFNSTLKL